MSIFIFFFKGGGGHKAKRYSSDIYVTMESKRNGGETDIVDAVDLS